jgi:hypothetical protein
MTIDKPRLTLEKPIHWIRNEQHPSLPALWRWMRMKPALPAAACCLPPR